MSWPALLPLFRISLRRWANSALVVGILPEDWAPWEAELGALAGIGLQESVERRAAKMGGGNLVAPVQASNTDRPLGEKSGEGRGVRLVWKRGDIRG